MRGTAHSDKTDDGDRQLHNVAALAEHGVDAIFYPCMPYNFNEIEQSNEEACFLECSDKSDSEEFIYLIINAERCV